MKFERFDLEMSMAFDAQKYKNQWERENYARISIKIPKSKKRFVDELRETTGKSINRIFIEAVEKQYGIDLTIDEEKLQNLYGNTEKSGE